MCIQGSLTISACFTKFRGLWDELSSLLQSPKCVSNCICGASRLQDEYEHVYKLTQFLMGLSDNYTDVRGQILRMTPLPSITKVISMLTREESQRQCVNSVNVEEISTTLFSKNAGSRGFRGNKSRTYGSNDQYAAKGKFFCDYCHGDSHKKINASISMGIQNGTNSLTPSLICQKCQRTKSGTRDLTM